MRIYQHSVSTYFSLKNRLLDLLKEHFQEKNKMFYRLLCHHNDDFLINLNKN